MSRATIYNYLNVRDMTETPVAQATVSRGQHEVYIRKSLAAGKRLFVVEQSPDGRPLEQAKIEHDDGHPTVCRYNIVKRMIKAGTLVVSDHKDPYHLERVYYDLAVSTAELAAAAQTSQTLASNGKPAPAKTNAGNSTSRKSLKKPKLDRQQTGVRIVSPAEIGLANPYTGRHALRQTDLSKWTGIPVATISHAAGKGKLRYVIPPDKRFKHIILDDQCRQWVENYKSRKPGGAVKPAVAPVEHENQKSFDRGQPGRPLLSYADTAAEEPADTSQKPAEAIVEAGEPAAADDTEAKAEMVTDLHPAKVNVILTEFTRLQEIMPDPINPGPNEDVYELIDQLNFTAFKHFNARLAGQDVNDSALIEQAQDIEAKLDELRQTCRRVVKQTLPWHRRLMLKLKRAGQ